MAPERVGTGKEAQTFWAAGRVIRREDVVGKQWWRGDVDGKKPAG